MRLCCTRLLERLSDGLGERDHTNRVVVGLLCYFLVEDKKAAIGVFEDALGMDSAGVLMTL